MKAIRVIAVIAFLIMVFISIDLGINCMGALIPEFQDGIPYNSILQSQFGLLENWGVNTRADFFCAFQRSLLITYFLLVMNVILAFCKKR